MEAVARPVTIQNITRRSVQEETGYRSAFEPNPIQMALFSPIFHTDDNIIIASGTGTGKTVPYEWGMWKTLQRGHHVIILAPNKSLVEQKAEAWRTPGHSLSRYPLIVKTGDYLDIDIEDVRAYPIKIMTPEALAVVLRSPKAAYFIAPVSLLVVDEVHLLGTKGRGNGLEASIVQFFEKRKAFPELPTRVIAASASVDNASLRDVALWFQYLSGKQVHALVSDWRPTPLEYHTSVYIPGQYYNQTEAKKMQAVLQLVIGGACGTHTIIFSHTKKFGYKLVDKLREAKYTAEFHCADLKLEKRLEIEHKFEAQEIQYLVATSTLAVGCDFTTEHVVISGVHRGLNLVERDTLQQMAGRAGHKSSCKVGHVHVVIPNTIDDIFPEYKSWLDYIKLPYHVTSELCDPKWLAFHTIALINRNGTATKKMLLNWYRQTLAFIQEQKMIQDFEALAMSDKEDSLLNETIGYLLRTEGIRKLFGDSYEATLIGKAAATFYLDTADVQKLYQLLPIMVGRSHAVASAIMGTMGLILEAVGNLKGDIIPPAIIAEQERSINEYCSLNKFSLDVIMSLLPNVPGKFIYWVSLYAGEKFQKREEDIPAYTMLSGTIREVGRLTACCQFLAGVDKDMKIRARNFEDTALRVVYGAPDELLDLIRISNVGLKRAEILYENGLHGPKDVDANPMQVKALFGDKVGQKILECARKLLSR